VGLWLGGGRAKKTISGGRARETGTGSNSFTMLLFLVFLFLLRILHFHQDLVEDVHVAGKGQRTLAAVAILGFCFFEKRLEQRVVSVLGLDDEPLHLGSNVDGETTFGCHNTTVTAFVLSLAAGPGFAPHHHHSGFSSSNPLGDEPLSHLLSQRPIHITHLQTDSNTTLNI